MKFRNWEDWAFALTFAAAVAVAIAMSATQVPSFTGIAFAAEQPVRYTMTITAKRLPAECKGLGGNTAPAACAALIDAQTITMREVR